MYEFELHFDHHYHHQSCVTWNHSLHMMFCNEIRTQAARRNHDFNRIFPHPLRIVFLMCDSIMDSRLLMNQTLTVINQIVNDLRKPMNFTMFRQICVNFLSTNCSMYRNEIDYCQHAHKYLLFDIVGATRNWLICQSEKWINFEIIATRLELLEIIRINTCYLCKQMTSFSIKETALS